MQIVQKRSALHDNDLKMEIQEKIINILNENLPEGFKIKFEDLYEFNHDEKHVENIEKAIARENDEQKQKDLIEEYKVQFPDKRMVNSINRLGFVFMNPNPKNEEEKEDNKNLYLDLCDENKVSLYIEKYTKDAFNFNLLDHTIENETEAIDQYTKDPKTYEMFHQIGAMYINNKAQIHPALCKIFYHQVPLFESMCNCQGSKEVLTNPMSMFLPTSLFNEMNFAAYTASRDKINKMLLEEYPDIEEFKDEKFLKASVNDFGFQNITFNDFIKRGKTVKELGKQGKITGDFALTKTFVKDGRPVSFSEALEGINDGVKGFEIEEIDEASKERFKAALKENIYFKEDETTPMYNKLFDDIKKSCDDLNESKGLFTRDSKQFKELNTALNSLSKIIDNARLKASKCPTELEKLNVLGRAYILNIDKFNNLKNLSRNYLEYKNGQINNGKKMNTRSNNRINIVNNLENIVDSNPLKVKFDKSLEIGKIIARKQVEGLNGVDKNVKLSKAVSKNKNKEIKKQIEF